MSKEEYLEFMFNADNVENCDNCPENNGFDNWQNRKPCGQQNCWVACHINSEKETE